MSFLDRFKLQPKHKSTDPEVRAASVAELGDGEEDAGALLALAREDSDARVRRAAVARVEDVSVLAAIAGSDGDQGIREELLARLGTIAANEAADRAAVALGALIDPKQISNVAKTSPHDSVRTGAVARLTTSVAQLDRAPRPRRAHRGARHRAHPRSGRAPDCRDETDHKTPA